MLPYRKKPFAEQIGVCGADFLLDNLTQPNLNPPFDRQTRAEFPYGFNALFRSLSYDYGTISRICVSI